MVIKCAGLS